MYVEGGTLQEITRDIRKAIQTEGMPKDCKNALLRAVKSLTDAAAHMDRYEEWREHEEREKWLAEHVDFPDAPPAGSPVHCPECGGSHAVHYERGDKAAKDAKFGWVSCGGYSHWVARYGKMMRQEA